MNDQKERGLLRNPKGIYLCSFQFPDELLVIYRRTFEHFSGVELNFHRFHTQYKVQYHGIERCRDVHEYADPCTSPFKT